MPDKAYPELDPVFETMGLLFVSYGVEEVRQETKKSLFELGVDGEQFYTKYLTVYDKYIESFLKYMSPDPEAAFFFSGIDMNYLLILLSLILENRNWLSSADHLSDHKINTELIRILKCAFEKDTPTQSVETLEDIIKFLDSIGLAENAKWRLLGIMQQPKKNLLQLIGIINSNTDSFRKAESEIKKPLSRLLEQYQTSVNAQADKTFHQIKGKLAQNSVIYPSLVFPASQIMSESSCHYGLLCDMVQESLKVRLRSKESLLLKLKALSDSSKLEILTSLKISPKYNLEIAQQLGLTAATMSHHMSVLLNCGFVGVDKKDGKVYYHLEKEPIKEMLDELERTLL